MQLHNLRYLSAVIIFSALSFCAFPSFSEEQRTSALLSLNSDAKIKLKELAFGEILYDYYQRNYFSSLTRLDVAEYRNEVVEHVDHIKLLRGVMFLSYGMLESAEKIFVELLDENSQNEKLAQVRFYLAKTHYLNGKIEQAESHLERTFEFLPEELVDEALLIRSQIAFQKGDIAASKAFLEEISTESEKGKYAQFNLAVYLLQAGDLEKAVNLFDNLYPNRESNDIERSLFDRANLALGYYYLEKKQAEDARQHLINVRLNGPFSNRAILALGWAYYEGEELAKAIGHWQELTTRDPRDPSVQEATMALAFAYYRNGAKKEALEAFVTAAANFGEQLTLIEKAKTDIKAELFQRWLDSRGIFGDKVFEQWAEGDVPVTGHAIEYYLQEVVTTNEFTQFFQRFQEMSHLKNVLNRWQRQLPVFEQMLANHELRYQTLKPKIDEQASQMLKQNFAEQYESLASIAERQTLSDDLWLLANQEELEVYHDLMRVKKTMDALPADQFDMEDQREQWRRIYGAALWNLAEKYGPKKYRLEKQLKETRAALAELKQQTVSIRTSGQKASSRFLNYDKRIIDLKNQILNLLLAIELRVEQSRKSMELVLLQKLEKREQELDFLLAQTELSIAKIQDEAINRMLEQRQ
ncbi:tetratricopeptide repeat protein [Pleionea sediminis]|uniref:tetratricopeptide repeat protein n=1 Tax=Pleionea sediminis TaxID=2569479 RepID=UPI001186A3E2|nr:tetratricopeptide repeat protein [Pleionea sediminis]